MVAPPPRHSLSSVRDDLGFGRKKKPTFTEKFKQQTLPAWQPIFNASRVVPLLILLGILFVPIGAGIWILSDQIQTFRLDYTHCLNIANSSSRNFNESCGDLVSTPELAMNTTCLCRLKFNLTEDFRAPVYIYYFLTNFHQNHREYVSSRDDRQLRGEVGTAEDPVNPSSACKPFVKPTDDNEDGKRVYFPCGAIADSMFSDAIRLFYNVLSTDLRPTVVPLNRTGIAWPTDQKYKFTNPCWFKSMASDPDLQRTFVKPKHWKKNIWELDPENPENNGLNNEDLIVWMRTAALPDFRKLFRRIQHDNPLNATAPNPFKEHLPKGEYIIEIDYNFPVTAFSGTKTIIISNTNVFGSSNSFLGITYVITGSVCIGLAVFMLIVQISVNRINRKPEEKSLRKNFQTQKYYGS